MKQPFPTIRRTPQVQKQVFRPDIYVGIDPGVNTGVAIWDTKKQRFKSIDTYNIIEALHTLSLEFAGGVVRDGIAVFNEASVHFIIEDARKRKGDAGLTDEKKQGAGSVKRDSKIWQEFCEYYNIPYTLAAPNGKLNKIAHDRKMWEMQTGYKSRTSEHARCAAMLVWKR